MIPGTEKCVVFRISRMKTSTLDSAMVLAKDTTKTHKVILNVKGMTCAGCETHMVTEVNKLKGVQSVFASYADGTTTIEFSQDSLTQLDIVMAIDKTGYQVINKPENKD